MGEWLKVAGSRGLGRVAGFGIGLALLTGDSSIAVFAAACDVLWSAIDTATLRGGDVQ